VIEFDLSFFDDCDFEGANDGLGMSLLWGKYMQETKKKRIRIRHDEEVLIL
jgi:hypothetical protein